MTEIPPSTLQILLLGKAGSGKSSLGNLILSEKAFKVSKLHGTTKCQLEKLTLPDSTELIVVDTPGYGNIKLSEEETNMEINRGMDLLVPGPVIIIYTISLSDRVTGEDILRLNKFKIKMGHSLKSCVIPVFTGMDELIEEDVSLEEHFQTLPKQYQEFIEDCGKRLIGVNSKHVNNHVDSKQILDVIKQFKGMDVGCLKDKDGGSMDVVRNEDRNIQKNPKGKKEQQYEEMETVPSNNALDGVKDGNSRMSITPQSQTNQKNIFIMGKAGSGKSSVGNLILGKKVFKASKLDGTTKCQLEKLTLPDSTELIVVDTPGYGNIKLLEEETNLEIKRGMDLLVPGPVIIIYTSSLSDRVTGEDILRLNKFKNKMGHSLKSCVIPVFTGMDSLIEEDKTLEEHFQTLPKQYQEFIEDCGKRLIGVNSKHFNNPVDSKQILDVIKQLEGMNVDCLKDRYRLGTDTEVQMKNEKSAQDVIETNNTDSDHQGQAANNDTSQSDTGKFTTSRQTQTRNILLLGKSGIGKSSVGNVLLGEKRFKTSMMEDRGTKSCQVEIKDNLTLVDTPGFFSSLRSDVSTATHIIGTLWKRLSIHVLMLVLSVDDRFTGDEEKILDLIMKIFGKEMVNNMVVIFTGKDSVVDDDDGCDDGDFEHLYKVPECLPKGVPHFVISCKSKCKGDIDAITKRIFSPEYQNPLIIKHPELTTLEEIHYLEEARKSENRPDPDAYRQAVCSGLGLDSSSTKESKSFQEHLNTCQNPFN